MYTECQNCHANNHIRAECINCHAELTLYHTQPKPLFKQLLKLAIAYILLIALGLSIYEYQFRDKLFPQLSRNSITQEYQAIDECMKKFYTYNNKLSICSNALEKLQTEYPNNTNINPIILNALAEIQSQQLQ